MKRTLVLFACGAALTLASDPWKDKKPADWTEKDAAKVLTNSPWAKIVTAEMTGGLGGRRGAGGMVGVDGGPGRRGGGGSGGPSGASGSGGLIGSGDGPTGGGDGRGSESMPSGPRVVVRWETSDPLIEAFGRVEYSLLPKLREWSKEFYVITAAGMPVMGAGGERQRPGVPQGNRPQIDPKQMMERFVRTTSLKRKGKDPISPVRIEMIRAGDQLVPMFFFSRKDAITPEDKQVTFESTFGPASVKSKFILKNMVYDGKLSL